MNPDDEPTQGGSDGVWEWHPYPSCAWIWRRLGNTPIIIDTDGSGFHLTSAANGIKFDFFGNGQTLQVAWTQPGSTNGWLAIDLNGNGVIDSGQELFGNASPQPPLAPNEPDSDLNGFRALAEYDTNGDGVINKKDAQWGQLLVWIDTNHDGVSQPNELHHLDDIGIHSISLKYTQSPMTDAYGNQFKLKGHLNPDKGDNVNRVIYDVYLTTAQ